MAGYYGYSMSNNAIDAYERNEKPISKWTKKDIMEELVLQGASSSLLETVKKIRLKVLREVVLEKCGWHHTGKFYNRTDFYRVDASRIDLETIDSIAQYSAMKFEQPKTKVSYRKVRYYIWFGTRRYPKKKEVIERCKVEGNWAYTVNGKKNIHANGFQFMD